MVPKNLSTENPDGESWKLIRDHPIFSRINDHDIRKILPFFRFVSLQSGEIFIEEGVESSRDLYLILQGDLEVIKNKQFIVARLTSGDALGELSFIKGDPRSASIKSTTEATLLSLTPDDFTRMELAFPGACNGLLKNMVGYVAERLKQTSANEIKALKIELQNSVLNSQANIFFSYVIGLLCVYNLTIHIITNLSMDANQASIISAVIILVFCVVLILMIRQSKLPIQIFGLTTKHWKPALRESLFWSCILIAIFIAIKWMLIHYVARYQSLSLFDFNLTQQKYLAFNFILYGLHSPIQEFIARGVLQGSLQHFFTGKNIAFRSIIVSNALFSATHVHLMSGLLGVIVFIPGLFWGWLYARNPNLIGVSISHLLIGWTGLFFLNLESLF
jgi:membrane protease YdiL (CAAX protease family)